MVLVDLEFKKKIMDTHIYDTLKYCYQCARCTDVCPVSKETDGRYNPRFLILNSFLGLKDKIFEAPFNIWGCTVCDTCDEVCPQKIELTEIFYILKNMSMQQGDAPGHFTGQASVVLEHGKAIPSQPAIERRREQLGLPQMIPPDVDEVKKLLELTKLSEKLPKTEEKDKGIITE